MRRHPVAAHRADPPAGFAYLKPQVIHRLVDGAARGQITTAAPRREPRQARYEQTDHFIHVADCFLQRD
jgi:hypothetical protein